MPKALKITLATLGLLIVIVIGAFIGIATFVNPNQFKPTITKIVKEKTGRTLTINGDLNWSFLPWLGLEVHNVELGNPDGFAQKSMMKMDEIDFRVRLWPMLFGNIEFGTITINNLDLTLTKTSAGKSNWQDLTQQPESTTDKSHASATTTDGATTKLAALSISGVDINHAHVLFDDQSTKTHYELSELNLTSKNIGLNQSFPFDVKFNLASNKQPLNGNVAFSGKVTLQPEDKKYQIEDLDFKANLSNHITLSFQTNLMLNQATGELANTDFQFQLNEMLIQGTLAGSDMFSKPSLQGTIKAPNFNLKKLINDLNITQLTTADPDALTKINFNAKFQADANAVNLRNLQLNLDHSSMTGEVSYKLNQQPTLFNLSIDKINLDSYLPSSSTKVADNTISFNLVSSANAETRSNSNHNNNPGTPLNGDIQIGDLTVNHMKLSKLTMHVNGANNVYTIDPIKANFYQGTYYGSTTIDLRNHEPVITNSGSLQNVQSLDLMKDLSPDSHIKISGTADINTKLKMRGSSSDAIKKSLSGNITYVFKNGKIEGININHYMDVANAIIEKKSPPSAPLSQQTEFGNLSGTMDFNNGIGSTNNLVLTGQHISANGRGTMNLVSEQLDFHINAIYKNAGNQYTVPLLLTGTFSSPKVAPDLENLAKMQIQIQMNKQTEKLKNKVNEIIQKKLGPNSKDIGDQIQKGLNSLLH